MKATTKAFLRAFTNAMHIKLRSEFPSIYPLEEVIRTAHHFIFFSPASPFNERFNVLIERMIASGYMEKYLKAFENNERPKECFHVPDTWPTDGIEFLKVLEV
jgi:hypothetical protein